jgi:ACS family sodium-dependent inorganic phosphate cotransporter
MSASTEKAGNEKGGALKTVGQVQKAEGSSASIESDGSVPPMGVEAYIIIGLCCLCGTISSLDRMAMSVCIVPLSTEFGYTETIKGSISSIFSIGYTLALFPLAFAQVVVSPKYIMAMGVATWSLLTVLTPITATMGIPYLLGARMGVGAAEAVAVPTIQTFVSRWVPKSQRTRALSLLYSCLQGGTILALLIAPAIVQNEGYPGVFTTFGALGFGWLAVWLAVSRDTPRRIPPSAKAQDSDTGATPALGSPNSRSPATLELVERSDPQRSKSEEVNGVQKAITIAKQMPWGSFLSSKGLWAATVAHSANNWGLYVSLAWLPTYFTQQYGMDLGK